MQRTWGLGGSDFGTLPMNWVASWRNRRTSPRSRRAITVNASRNQCLPDQPGDRRRARPHLRYLFNVSTPTPGSMVNDVIAQVRLYRTGTRTDPAGLMRVQGILSICTTADCISAATVGNFVDLGTAMVGTPVTVSMQWDKPGKTFYFGREGFPTRHRRLFRKRTPARPASRTAPLRHA
jgi:hypothetical protein